MPSERAPLHRFIRTIQSVVDPKQREFLWVDTLASTPPEIAVDWVRRLLHEGWTTTDAGGRLALETAMATLACDDWPPAHRRETFEAALATGDRLVSLMVGSDFLYADPVSDETLPVPTYRADRILTLGERKASARRPNRTAISAALRDPHPAVIEKLLDNPRLTEPDAVFIAAQRPVAPEVLTGIGRHPKWRLSPRVALAVVSNPQAVLRIALSLLHNIGRPAAEEAAAAPSLSPPLREALGALLSLS